MKLLKSCVSWLCVALMCASLVGQDQPTFKTNTNLVIVNISVKDKSGKLIDNLKKEDFVVYEDNKPQTISVFEVERLASTPLTPETAPALKTRPAENKAAPPARRPEAILGEHAKEYKDRRLIALFFDFSSMQPSEQIRAQDAALKFLNEQMTASDLVSVMTYSNRLRVVEDFTNDRESLITTIRGANVNSNGRIPVLQVGNRFIPESNAACYYVAEGSPLIPTDPFDHADMLRWMFWEQYNHEPNIATLRFWMRWVGVDQLTDLQRLQMSGKRQAGNAALKLMDEHLAGRDWLVGESPTLADVCLFAYTHVAGDAQFDLRQFPNVSRWIDRMKGQPRYIALDG